MRARAGDTLHIHSNAVEVSDQFAKIVEVRGEDGAPPYLVRFPDDHETLMWPGPDCVVESSSGLR